MSFTKHRGASGATVLLLVVGLVLAVAGPANATVYPGPFSGTKLCNVPKSALLTTNSLSSAGIRFTNYNNLAQSYGFTITGGYHQSSSAYTNTFWQAESGQGFYLVPTATCN